MNWTHYLFSFNGRINRAKWWLFLLVCLGYVIGAMVIAFVFGAINLSLAAIWGLIVLLGYLVLYFSALAVSAKRLHDRNKSAWWLLLFYGIPFALGAYAYSNIIMGMMGVGNVATSDPAAQQQMMGAMIAMMSQMWWVSLINTVIFVWIIVDLGILEGTRGDNQYGPDPLAGVAH